MNTIITINDKQQTFFFFLGIAMKNGVKNIHTNKIQKRKKHCIKKIIDPPESIHIFGYDEQKALQHETVQRLTCKCNGGNPLCTPKWFKNDKELNEGTQISVNGNTVTNELGKCIVFFIIDFIICLKFSLFTFSLFILAVFRVDPSDNTAMYKCTGENSASITPIKAVTTLTVHCKFVFF